MATLNETGDKRRHGRYDAVMEGSGLQIDSLSEAASREVGAPPTQIVRPEDAAETRIVTRLYDANSCRTETGYAEAEEGKLRWIDIVGLDDAEQIAWIMRGLGLSELAIAELFQTDQRPKTEALGDWLQIYMRVPTHGLPFRSEQLALVLGPGFVLSLRENQETCFTPVERRLESGSGQIRKGAAYLFYALTDAVLDLWFPLLEAYGDRMEDLEQDILSQPGEGAVQEVHRIKHDLLAIRRAIWPLREAMGALVKDEMPQIEDWVRPFLRDCVDHAFQALDMVEVYREVAQGLVDLQLSMMSNQMNEVMKLLAIISTIFIPMTFIAGVYGMNFDTASPWNLPELGWRFGYEYALGLMLLSATVMVYVFYRLGWIGRKTPRPPRGDADDGA